MKFSLKNVEFFEFLFKTRCIELRILRKIKEIFISFTYKTDRACGWIVYMYGTQKVHAWSRKGFNNV